MDRASKRLIIILIISLLLFTSCGSKEIIDTDWDQDASTAETVEEGLPEDQINHILQLVAGREQELLKSYLTAESLARYGDDQIIARQKEIDKKLRVSQVNLYGITLVEMLSDQNIEVYEMTMSFTTEYGPIERPLTVTFIRNRQLDRWEMEWTPATIFPGLTLSNDIVVEELAAPRGTIYDRTGRELAVDGLSQQVGAVTGVYDMSKHAEVAALLDMTTADVEKKMTQSWIKDNMFVPLQVRSSYTPEQTNRFGSYGLSVRTISARIYPYDKAFAHLIGYTAEVSFSGQDDPKHEFYRMGDKEGKRGLEAHYEEQLRSTRGVRVSLTGGGGEVLFERAAIPGQDFYLTVDAELQQKIYDVTKDDSSATTAVDPFSGDILALVSTPAFSPNAMATGMSNSEYQQLVDSPQKPMLNRFQLRYPPGSTFKIPTAIAAFNTGVLTEDTVKTIKGKKWQADSSWGGYQVSRLVENNEPQDGIKAIAISDNIFFAQLAVEMGSSAFYDQLLKLGLTEEVPSEYPFYTAKITNSGQAGSEVLMADTAYGQGELQITQVQLAAIYASLVNGGKILEPHILRGNEQKIWKENFTSPPVLDYLRRALRRTVETTHKNTAARPYAEFAGKSGTVQRGWDKDLDKQVIDTWFIGFDNVNTSLILVTQMQDMQRREDKATAFTRWGELMDSIYADGPYQVP